MNYYLLGVLLATALGFAFRRNVFVRVFVAMALLWVAVSNYAGMQALQKSVHVAINDLKSGKEALQVTDTLEEKLARSARIPHPSGLVSLFCLALLTVLPRKRRKKDGGANDVLERTA